MTGSLRSLDSRGGCPSVSLLGFLAYGADAAYQVVGWGLSLCDGEGFDGRGMVVGAEKQVVSGPFDVSDGAIIVFQNSVQIQFSLAIRLK